MSLKSKLMPHSKNNKYEAGVYGGKTTSHIHHFTAEVKLAQINTGE